MACFTLFSSASQFLQSEDASGSALEIASTFGSASRRLARAVAFKGRPFGYLRPLRTTYSDSGNVKS